MGKRPKFGTQRAPFGDAGEHTGSRQRFSALAADGVALGRDGTGRQLAVQQNAAAAVAAIRTSASDGVDAYALLAGRLLSFARRAPTVTGRIA